MLDGNFKGQEDPGLIFPPDFYPELSGRREKQESVEQQGPSTEKMTEQDQRQARDKALGFQPFSDELHPDYLYQGGRDAVDVLAKQKAREKAGLEPSPHPLEGVPDWNGDPSTPPWAYREQRLGDLDLERMVDLDKREKEDAAYDWKIEQRIREKEEERRRQLVAQQLPVDQDDESVSTPRKAA